MLKSKIVNSSKWGMMLLGVIGICFFAPDIMALASGDTLQELNDVVTTGQKMTKTVCYIIALASGAVGTYRFVQTQSFATASVAGAITVAAFKFPTLVTGAVLV